MTNNGNGAKKISRGMTIALGTIVILGTIGTIVTAFNHSAATTKRVEVLEPIVHKNEKDLIGEKIETKHFKEQLKKIDKKLDEILKKL